MKTYILPASIVILAVSLLVSAFLASSHLEIGSVVSGGEYRASTVDSSTGTSTVKTIFGSVGSVVITDAGSAGSIHFYDTSSTTVATSTLTEIFSVDGAAAENTYQFDVAFGNGLLIEERAFNGTAIVTYR